MDRQHQPHNHPTATKTPEDKLSIFVKITKVGLAITLAGLLVLEALIASDWRLLQATSCGTLSVIPAASVEAFA